MTAYIRKNIFILLSLLYSAFITVGSIIVQSNLIMDIHGYVSPMVSFSVAFIVMRTAIKTQDKGIMLYIVLGINCLALGNLYFFLLMIVRITPGVISVGLLDKICCYLFFIAALLEYKKQEGKRSVVYFSFINVIAFVLTIISAYSVLVNSIYIINISVILMSIFCFVIALGLLSNKKARFFACLMMAIPILDIISTIDIFTVFILSLSPFLYLLFASMIHSMKEDVIHVC